MLEHHAHVHAERVGVHLEDVLPVELDRSLGLDRLHEVAHAIERAQQRGLSASRRSDEGGRAVLGNLERDALQRLEIAVPQIEVADGERALHALHAAVDILVELSIHSLLHQPNLPVR